MERHYIVNPHHHPRRRCSVTNVLIMLLIATLVCNIIFLLGAIRRLDPNEDFVRSVNFGFQKQPRDSPQINEFMNDDFDIENHKRNDGGGDLKEMESNIDISPLKSQLELEKQDSSSSTSRTTTTTTAAATATTPATTITTTTERQRKNRKRIHLKLLSSKTSVTVSIDGKTIYEKTKSDDDRSRGIHVVVLNEITGFVMAARIFDVYQHRQDEELVRFLKMVRRSRIVVFLVKDEGAAQFQVPSRHYIQQTFGSREIRSLGYRDMWAFVSLNRQWLVEGHRKAMPGGWGLPVDVQAFIELQQDYVEQCNWGVGEVLKRRKQLCDRYEGYGSVCDCQNPGSIDLKGDILPNSRVSDIPISVIAGNRPYYLFRMLRGLLTTPGVDPKMVTVYIDGFFDEVEAIPKLFNVQSVQHTPLCSKNCRISQHYLRSLRETFDGHPTAEYMIILEEDLDVSKDIMDYFSQLIPVLSSDPSVYCISAWNDQGYKHSCNDPSMLYRVETMPGLGWVLKRKLFKEELESKWPSQYDYSDWDMWMRMPSNIKGRECIIPDVSRTYHFGAKGLNVGPYFQEYYFLNHALNNETNVNFDVSKVTKDGYEDELHQQISKAEVLDHSKTPCSHDDFIPNTTGHTYVMYIHQNNTRDWDTWNNVARCFKIWDLDVRGFHKQMWRFWIKKNKLFVIASSSPYIKYKPENVIPIFMLDMGRLKREAEQQAAKKLEEETKTKKHN